MGDPRGINRRVGLVGGRREPYRLLAGVVADLGADGQPVFDIYDPDVPSNARGFVAFDLAQASPQSFCSNDAA